jgi:probable nitrogen fixation protein
MTAQQGRFLSDLVDQLRACDMYGRLDRLPSERLIQPYLLNHLRLIGAETTCGVDPASEARIRAFFQAVAAGAERATGKPTTVLVDLNDEGFGQAAVFAGRLVVVCEALRAVADFGFASIEKLTGHGESLVSRAIDAINAHPEVAADDY